jgi:hypothetical protein
MLGAEDEVDPLVVKMSMSSAWSTDAKVSARRPATQQRQALTRADAVKLAGAEAVAVKGRLIG